MPNTIGTGSAPNKESYKDNGDGTVTDNITGLMWQQSGGGIIDSQTNAIGRCEALTLAGYADWRLPTLIELMSIVDPDNSQYINTVAFPDGRNFEYMTATPVFAMPQKAWYVPFQLGGVAQQDDISFADYMARCVR
jgi:hypothetical protein